MKIQLLIATADHSYAEHLSRELSEKYADVFGVSVCSSGERLKDLLTAHSYEIALLEPDLADGADLNAIRLPLLLRDGTSTAEMPFGAGAAVSKYQRISKMIGEILGRYAEVSPGGGSDCAQRAKITAVWSPAGGTGKTSVALAYAAHCAADGKKTVYLDLELFSSTKLYFEQTGKSISAAFEKLDGNIELLLRSIQQQDRGSGITYFCHPDNYDDMNILTAEDLDVLVSACAKGVDELVIDLSSVCDARTRGIFGSADTIFLVCDASGASRVKMEQFATQNDLFMRLQAKLVLIANKGAKPCLTGIERVIRLPYVHADEAPAVYRSLAADRFGQ